MGYTVYEQQKQPITVVHHHWEAQSHELTEMPIAQEIPYSPILILGRYDNCDIKITNAHVSRYHVVMFMYREAIVVLDSWSLVGTVCTDMNMAYTRRTVQDERKLLIYPANTPLHMLLGQHCIVFNPQPCMRCDKNYRYYCLPRVLCEYNKHYYDQNREIISDKVSCHHALLCFACRKELVDYYRPFSDDVDPPAHQPETSSAFERLGWDGHSYVLKIGEAQTAEGMVCKICQR